MILCAAFFNKVKAQETPVFTKDGKTLEVRNTPNNTLVELYKAGSTFNFNIAVATFPAGKKLDRHYHPGGQILIITVHCYRPCLIMKE